MILDWADRTRKFFLRQYLRKNAKNFGENNSIHHTLTAKYVEKLAIGNNCLFYEYVILRAKSDSDIGIAIGNNVTLKSFVYISSNGGQIIIKDHAGIGHHAWISGVGKVTVGNYTIIGGYTSIVSSNHDYLDRKIPYCEKPEIPTNVVIGKNVWIGTHCVVLSGVTIGDNSVVGAGSIVTKDIPESCLAVGSPATIKKRY